ncbi:MAG TPA: polysaccharide biosynthesis tyrosine autokinase [Arachnia sp.]|nr:polysaccharide biosynthesis tyrosine autokinase [Arachnia sp.]HMT85159.1 polysaccharide biosynthesis tyrosine autokinase [Arachnia sp.]
MELTDYWKIIRAHWISILAIAAAGAILGLGWALLQPRVYTSNASGVISTGLTEDVGMSMVGDNLARSRAATYVDLGGSRTVAEMAAEQIGYTGDPGSLISHVSVTNPLNTATIKVSANAGSPEEAQNLSEAWVQALGQQIDAIENEGASGGQASVIQLRSLDAASLPTSPSSPNTRLAVAIGFLAGLVLAFGYAMMRSVFDRRVQSIAQVQQETSLPVIGTVPFHPSFDKENRIVQSKGGNDRSSSGAEEYAVAESIRALRTNLQYMDIDNPPRVMVVTSALPGEGKSTVVANLANAIAQGGQRVVVVDGDLRRPMVAKTFDVLPGIGLTDVLVGQAELSEVLQPWGDTGRLLVLGAGKVPPNPSELLGSNTMHKVLEELSKHAIVLIDAPPLLPVTDAAILTARTDGAMIITYARRSTIDALKEAISNLERVKGRPLGVIINGVPQKGVRADGYGYRYRSYSYYGRTDGPSGAKTKEPEKVKPAQHVDRPEEDMPAHGELQLDPVVGESARPRRGLG